MDSIGLIYLITDRDNLNEAFKKVRRSIARETNSYPFDKS